jgi:hypothetical protein
MVRASRARRYTMPGLDKRGPAGTGPMTGWRRGWCTPAEKPVNAPGTMSAAHSPEENRSEIPGPAEPVYIPGQGGLQRGYGRGFGNGRRRGNFN